MKYLLFLSLILSSNLSFACSCITAGLDNSVIHAEVIITGKIISRENVLVKSKRDEDFGSTVAKYTILVTEKIKGNLKKNIVTVYGDASNCAYTFQVGENYIIYAIYHNKHMYDSKKVKKFLFTNKCTRTARFDSQEVDKIRDLCRSKGYS